jgi:membrane peptidoglycan carboxypeptidase
MKRLKKSLHWFKISPLDILIGLFAIFATLSIVSIFTYLYFASALQSKDLIMNNNNTGVILLDRNNQPFYRFDNAQIKTFIPLSQIPLVTRQAVLAAEDKDFYSHPGFSPKAIFGAMIADLKQPLPNN